jgi:DNA repair protein RadC
MENPPFRDWDKQDKPREKLMKHGPSVLSDSELLAILLGTGMKGTNVMELSKVILDRFDNKISKVARADVGQLTKIKGVGEAKAITILTALELGIRRMHEHVEYPKVTVSKDAADYLMPFMMDLSIEYFYCLYLDNQNQVHEKLELSKGGISSVLLDIRTVFQQALIKSYTKIILAHNHPSGNLEPSRQDIELTQKVYEASKILNITLLDHIIIANNKYYSLKDNGLF